MYSYHSERHFSDRNNWLRASVLGANDGLISTASLLTGVAAATPDFQTLLLTGVSALIGGAVSMAAGEYVSVSSQSDTEKADLHKECHELANNPDAELEELTEIYRRRGLSDPLAAEVAKALMEHDALAAHARDEIGITETSAAQPMQAALASAASFCAGAILPLLVALTASTAIVPALAVSTLCGLAGLGYVSAKLGGAPVVPAVLRVCLWGVAALVITGFIGKLAGVAV